MTRTDRLFLEGVFLLTLIVFSAAFLRLMQPFFLDIFLALVFANIFRKPFLRMQGTKGRTRLAASLTIVLVLLVVAIPVGIVMMLISTEIATGFGSFQESWPTVKESIDGLQIVGRLQALPGVGSLFAEVPEIDAAETVRKILGTGSDYIVKVSQRSFANVAGAVFNFIITLLLLFYILMDGNRLVALLYRTIPIANHEIDQIVRETFNTTSATLISTIIIGLMEGSLAVILFLIFGLSSPFLWGVITMVLSMIPLIGTNIILIPTGIITLASGRVFAGFAILAAGVVGVFITQNIIKPKLLGDRTALNPALALLATIGGIAWLGLIGFLVGPVVASLFIVIWSQFALRYKTLLAGKDTTEE